MRCLFRLWVAAGVSLCVVVRVSVAQTANPEPKVETGALQEIVVTAQRREEKLQDVPVSVSVVTAQDIQRLGAYGLDELAGHIPGLVLNNSSPGQSNASLRGIYAAAGDPTVATYIDDVPIPQFPTSATFVGLPDPRFFDLSRIEVLRGPQGTLFGADSEAGAIRYITNPPRLDTFEGDANAQLSDTDGGGPNYLVGGMLNFGVIPDHMALRISTQDEYDSGYIDRVQSTIPFSGTTTQSDINDVERFGVRIESLIRVNDNLDLTPSVYYQKAHLGDWNVFNNLLPEFETDFRGAGQPQNDGFSLSSLTIRYHLNGATLTSVSSYFDRAFDQVRDYSRYVLGLLGGEGSPVAQPFLNDTFTNTVQEPSSRYSQEFRLASDDKNSRLQWLTGAYYAHTKIESDQIVVDPQFVTNEVAAFGGTPLTNSNTLFLGDTQIETTEYAVFANATYAFSRAWSLEMGGRYFWNTRVNSETASGFFNGGVTVQPPLSTEENGLNPRVSLNFKPTENDLLYVSAAKGYRIGGPNQPIPVERCEADLHALGLTAPPASYGSDWVWSYELGSKNTFADGLLTINSALFYINWTNVQQEVPLEECGFGFTGNGGKAVSKGGETEFDLNPARGLTVRGSFSYTDATLQAAVPALGAQAGDPIEWVPKYTYSAGAEYQAPFGDGLTGYARGDFQWRSEAFRDFNPALPDYEEKAYGVATARFGVERGQWDISLYGWNLFNSQPILDMTFPSSNPVVYNDTTIQPRTIGLSFDRRF